MSGLFVPLDVEYDSDDKMIEAGPMAELLYVRGMAFAKRTGSDGNIRRSQLVIVGRSIPSAAKHAAALVRVGAWVETADGWHIAAWLKRNKPMAEIAADKHRRKAASQKANHDQYHTGPSGKPSTTCPLCAPISEPKSDASTVPKSAPKGREGKGEPKPEPEPEGREENSVGRLTGSTVTTEPDPTTTTDERIMEAIAMHADYAAAGKDNPRRYAATVQANDLVEHLDALNAHLVTHPTATAAQLAQDVLGLPRFPAKRDWYANPFCPICEGEGIARTDDPTQDTNAQPTYGPCACRQAEPYPELTKETA